MLNPLLPLSPLLLLSPKLNQLLLLSPHMVTMVMDTATPMPTMDTTISAKDQLNPDMFMDHMLMDMHMVMAIIMARDLLSPLMVTMVMVTMVIMVTVMVMVMLMASKFILLSFNCYVPTMAVSFY